jgi:hypothetical protein
MSFHLALPIFHRDSDGGGRGASNPSTARDIGMGGGSTRPDNDTTEPTDSDYDSRNYQDATGGDGPGGSPSNSDTGGASVPGGRDQS